MRSKKVNKVAILDTNRNLKVVPYFYTMRGGCVVTPHLTQKKRFNITHVATGYALASGLPKKHDALRLLSELVCDYPELDTVCEQWINDKDNRELLRPTVDRLQLIIKTFILELGK